MKTTGLHLLLFACILFVIDIGPCVALECYTCDDCGYPFDPSSAEIKTCPSGNACFATRNNFSDIDLYARDCIEADTCPPRGCFTLPHQTKCSYCCNENLCNNKSIADAVEDVKYCHNCLYSTFPYDVDTSTPACNDPLDPNGDGVWQEPCAYGQCSVITFNSTGQMIISRGCLSNTDAEDQCTPRCYEGYSYCATCCSGNLCNGGPVKFPPTEPSAAPPTIVAGKASLVANLLVSVALLVVLC